MSKIEELLRRAVLQDQVAILLRQDADAHEVTARKLREEAAMLEEQGP
jgi:hypothetical protein